MGNLMNRRNALSVIALIILLYVPKPLLALEPAAVIEEVNGTGLEYQAMDFLYEGDKIDLNGQEIVLSYMTSCSVERISGAGEVFIGYERSVVRYGIKVRRKQIICSKTSFDLSARQGAESAAIVFRTTGSKAAKNVIYSRFPVFAVGEGAGEELVVEASDGSERFVFLLNGNRLDTAGDIKDKAGKPFEGLKSGGRYSVKAGERTAGFSVDGGPEAASERILNRLVGF